MIIIFGLVVLLAAVIVGLTGVLSNSGDGHALTDGFAVFGYHVTGSTGTLFLFGIAVGALGMCGLSLLLAGTVRGRRARRELNESRSEQTVVSPEPDRRAEHQRDTVAASRGTADASPHGVDRGHRPTGGRDWRHPFGHRTTRAAAPHDVAR